MPTLEQHEERLKKVKALLLNKVEDCDWFHFEIDLNEGEEKQNEWSEETHGKVLDENIQPVGPGGGYKFVPEIKSTDTQTRSVEGETSSAEGETSKITRKDVLEKHILGWVLLYLKDDSTNIREIIRRIFDTNDSGIFNNSEADEGQLGIFNEKDRARRNKHFFKVMNKGFRDQKNTQNVVILAEGDSWFEFPRVSLRKIRLPWIGWDPVRDIVDHLMDLPRLIRLIRKKIKNTQDTPANLNQQNRAFAVKSLAAGGDWLSNMIHGAEYIEELRAISPDVFLFSGGGNDLLGNNRLAALVRDRVHEGPLSIHRGIHDGNPRYINALLEKRLNKKTNFPLEEEMYLRGLKWLRKDFFHVLSLCMTQYFLLVSEITKLGKYKKLLLITQGYDAPQPSNKLAPWWKLPQRIVNKSLGSGKWLYQPLMMKGITNPKDQEAIIYTMIYEFNEMLIQLAEYKAFRNLFHIDCRGVGKKPEDWFDEIHLTSKRYADVAFTFFTCINEVIPHREKIATGEYTHGKKVFRVVDTLKVK
ncbi:MAG: hypothetical protein AAFR61_10310 [Bacteroidota bacterium]